MDFLWLQRDGTTFIVAFGLLLPWLLFLQSTGSSGMGLSGWSLQDLELGLSSSGPPAQLLCTLWNLPGPGIWPMSPALAGGFLSTAAPVSEWVIAAQSCPILCDPMVYSLPGSSVHRILQARILEWVVISFSRGSSWPRDRAQVSSIAGKSFTIWVTGEAYY